MKRRSGKGTVYRHRGAWRAQGPLQADGERQELGTFPAREDALRALAAYEALTADRPVGLTLAAWGERWFRDRTTRGATKERSAWRTHIASHSIADRLVKRVTRQDVLVWLRELATSEAMGSRVFGRGKDRRAESFPLGRTISPQTQRVALRILIGALEGAVDAGILAANPARGVRMQRGATVRADEPEHVEGVELGWTWLTSAEIAALLAVEASPTHKREARLLAAHRLIWRVGIWTGLRPGELYGLRWCDVRLDGPRPEIHVRRSRRGPPKTARAVRRVPLFPEAIAALREQLRIAPGIGEALVFPSESGGCHAEGYQAGLATWLRRAGIARQGITIRTLRHTYASHLLQGTWTSRPLRLEEVRDLMGHSTIGVTQRYAHLSPGGISALMHTSSTHDAQPTEIKR